MNSLATHTDAHLAGTRDREGQRCGPAAVKRDIAGDEDQRSDVVARATGRVQKRESFSDSTGTWCLRLHERRTTKSCCCFEDNTDHQVLLRVNQRILQSPLKEKLSERLHEVQAQVP
ncbi:hypothetical protein C0Q70_15729 [Pomacea canaliculata]|uniref:Uncharacterized protein n=1 Tax=Pomacea canaliculata TaxID=400727 RepID=A0A2T7NVN0_POMCA|nr:hypothetical protein C0Q70_15729 [Pomacea canaliculata]